MSGYVPADAARVEWVSSQERTELGEALRRLLDVVVQTGASAAELSAAATAVDAVTDRLTASPAVRYDTSVARDSSRSDMSLVGGLSHPIAPQLIMELTEHGGSGEVVISKLFQGGPGLVHGGVIALLIDHAMGCVAATPDRPSMTVSLTLRYRRPTPIEVPLTVSVSLDRIAGRQLHLSATVSAGGAVTVEADAVFLTLTTENLATVFGPR
jgi:acyl-coenzyme A thioesterase PaaI-like protein